MKKGNKYLTKTNAVYQDTQQSLNNRIVTVDKVNGDHQIICRVDFDDNNSAYLPFDITELKKIK